MYNQLWHQKQQQEKYRHELGWNQRISVLLESGDVYTYKKQNPSTSGYSWQIFLNDKPVQENGQDKIVEIEVIDQLLENYFDNNIKIKEVVID